MIGSMTVGARWQSIAYPTKNVKVAIKGANGEKQILHGELFTNWKGEQILREGDGQERNVSSFLYASYPAVKADTHDFPIRLFAPITLVMMAYGLFIVASWKKLAGGSGRWRTAPGRRPLRSRPGARWGYAPARRRLRGKGEEIRFLDLRAADQFR